MESDSGCAGRMTVNDHSRYTNNEIHGNVYGGFTGSIESHGIASGTNAPPEKPSPAREIAGTTWTEVIKAMVEGIISSIIKLFHGS
jgi:hypothetical protein